MTSSPSSQEPLQPVPQRTAAAVLALVMLGMALVFIALGSWQLQRRVWKLDLIAKVESRIQAEAVALQPLLASAPSDLSELEYRRVQVQGQWLPQYSAWVVAATDLGSGYWLMMPLQISADGSVVWVNRGFVSQSLKGATPKDAQLQATVVGLLRKTEPHGTLLRSNQPDQDRWYSRDVAALSKRFSVPAQAMVFVDAQASGTAVVDPAQAPVPGLTVVNFANNHLQYALTWFAMAIMAVWAAVFVWRQRGRVRQVEHD